MPAAPAVPYEPADRQSPLPGARAALVLLLAINLFNYVDRQVLAAVESLIQHDLGVTKGMMGWTATAFLVSYMILSPALRVDGRPRRRGGCWWRSA